MWGGRSPHCQWCPQVRQECQLLRQHWEEGAGRQDALQPALAAAHQEATMELLRVKDRAIELERNVRGRAGCGGAGMWGGEPLRQLSGPVRPPRTRPCRRRSSC